MKYMAALPRNSNEPPGFKDRCFVYIITNDYHTHMPLLFTLPKTHALVYVYCKRTFTTIQKHDIYHMTSLLGVI